MRTQHPRLLQQVAEAIKARHYSPRTRLAYVRWIRQFVIFNNRRHPSEMGEREVTAFLTHLAVKKRVSASTQNQALSAILFLYGAVLGVGLPWLNDIVRAKRPVRLPTVLTREEVRGVLSVMQGTPKLVAILLYGSGMRFM